MDEDLLRELKEYVGTRIAEKRGKESRDSYAAKLGRKGETLRSIETAVNAATLEVILAISEHEGIPPNALLPSYVISQGASEREKELDALMRALGALAYSDIQTLRLCAEAIAEHRSRTTNENPPHTAGN